MAAEPTSLGIGIVIAGAMTFLMWCYRKLKRRAKQEDNRIAIAR